jgi:hypothetical protein
MAFFVNSDTHCLKNVANAQQTICFFVGLFFVKETNQVDIESGSHAESAAVAAAVTTSMAAGK